MPAYQNIAISIRVVTFAKNTTMAKRLPNVKSLYHILPKGAESGKEFGRIIDLLIFHDAKRTGGSSYIFSDSSGDFFGLDGISTKKRGKTGYQYKFYSSPLSSNNRTDIVNSLEAAYKQRRKLKLVKWVLVTPDDFTASTRKEGGDVQWFNELQKHFPQLELEHYGHTKILGLFLETPSICLFYYPELVPNGIRVKKHISEIRHLYNENLIKLYREIQFVGMSVYKQEATKGIPMEHIYIPLNLVSNDSGDDDLELNRINPLLLLKNKRNSVILGDPGSGKSTLLHFLALSGLEKQLIKKYKTKADDRLPIIIALRQYADELKSRKNLSLYDYILEYLSATFSLPDIDHNFFNYYLDSGKALLFFDGLDELPNPNYKEIIRDRISSFCTSFPGNTTIVSSRIVGYDSPFRFDESDFSHFRISRLMLPEITQFVKDWYEARIENPKDKEESSEDLIRILSDESNNAIRELAENPLLLTIVTLVHRIDAVLPDERIVLYQKCTETLLNTWHNWKFRGSDILKNKVRIERYNRRRMEAIASWMHSQSVGTGKNQRAIVNHEELLGFLVDHIIENEKSLGEENEPEEIATEFLEFIKKRAGLLIEAGDNQYSFVHLTFQEYLTSADIITRSEKDGAADIWTTIEKTIENPRWSEVTRLLIAGLKSDDSQRYLILKIIERGARKHSSKYLLLGGILVDGVESAQEYLKEILSGLIYAACAERDVQNYRQIVALIKNLLIKGTVTWDDLISGIEKQIEAKRIDAIVCAHFLASLGLNSQIENLYKFIKSRKTKNILSAFHTIKFINGSGYKKELEILSLVTRLMADTQPSTNLVAAAMLSIFMPFDNGKRLYDEARITLLHSMMMGHNSGPFHDFALNIIGFGQGDWIDLSQARLKASSTALRIRKNLPWESAEFQKIIRTNIREKEKLKRAIELSDQINKKIYGKEFVRKSLYSLSYHDPNYIQLISEIIPYFFSEFKSIQGQDALRTYYSALAPKFLDLLADLSKARLQKIKEQLEASDVDNITLATANWMIFLHTWALHFQYRSNAEGIDEVVSTLRKSKDLKLNFTIDLHDLMGLADEIKLDAMKNMFNSKTKEFLALADNSFWSTVKERRGFFAKGAKII